MMIATISKFINSSKISKKFFNILFEQYKYDKMIIGTSGHSSHE